MIWINGKSLSFLLFVFFALFSLPTIASDVDFDIFGYHVEICEGCTYDYDFESAAKAQIIVDPSGGAQINKMVVVGNPVTGEVRAYRVSKIVEQSFVRINSTPTSVPEAAALAFNDLFTDMEVMTG